jgi:DNA-binding MarR family transcriptional regulator
VRPAASAAERTRTVPARVKRIAARPARSGTRPAPPPPVLNSLLSMDEPRWLTDEQQRTWLQFVTLLVKLPAALETQLQRDAGLTHMGYFVLANLSGMEDRRLPMSRLAANASASLSRLSHVVSRLEAQGWVRRERCPDDGRVQIAVLTDEGHAKLVQAAPGHVDIVQQLVFDQLTPTQVRQLDKICTTLLAPHQQPR